jgi:hypothetical protein
MDFEDLLGNGGFGELDQGAIDDPNNLSSDPFMFGLNS